MLAIITALILTLNVFLIQGLPKQPELLKNLFSCVASQVLGYQHWVTTPDCKVLYDVSIEFSVNFFMNKIRKIMMKI